VMTHRLPFISVPPIESWTVIVGCACNQTGHLFVPFGPRSCLEIVPGDCAGTIK
jgi:hypothetical protein